MNYDLYGGWSATTGPNAPLADACAAAANQQGSATRFVKAWIDAGFPANKVTIIRLSLFFRHFSSNSN